ncbi:MAG: hypothetical protein Q9157_007739 [Trypethelium eluteriae]
MNWSEVCDVAVKFLPFLESKHHDLVEEMRGVADGAGVPFASILAMNVRTEIAYGMFQSDGCTSLAWRSSDNTSSFLAQNWDWQHEQKSNLISLRIRQQNLDEERREQELPVIHMITEAGIIGKIGMNSAGVGVCLNAIRARGVKFNALPCHLALRRCMEAKSRDAAIELLEHHGVASACHILVADAEKEGMGLECSAHDIVKLIAEEGVVTHTNHYILPHDRDVEEHGTWKDSPLRLKRINEMIGLRKGAEQVPSTEDIRAMLRDEQGYPTSINRHETPTSTVATLFTIVMDLKEGNATVTLGRPTSIEETVELEPGKA